MRGRTLLLLVGVALLLAGCMRRGRDLTTGPDSFWLTSTGFPGRADWPSVRLHLDRDAIAGEPRVSRLLRGVPEVAPLPARDLGWGVHRVDSTGVPLCELDVWLNGSEAVRPPLAAAEDVDDLVDGRVLSGLELHLGLEGPVRDPEGCGALLLWSEELFTGWDQPFRGRVAGVVGGELADTVKEVVLEPDGQRIRPDRQGRYRTAGVLPGVYEVVFLAPQGPLLRRWTRVYALAETRVDVEVARDPG